MVMLLLCLGLSCASPPPQVSPRLNVVLILTDDQGAHLSKLGTPGIRTPNVDRLAAEGYSFTNAFAAVPSCSPSRSSINTGMYPHANGHWRNTITPGLNAPDKQFGRESSVVDKVGIHEYIKTLPEILGEAGYFTAITQKFHMSPPWKFPYTARNPVHNNPEEYRKVIGSYIDKAEGQPFFFQANVSPPHRPLHKNLQQFPEYRVHPDSVAVPDDLPDTPELRSDLAEYYGNVQLADACAGAIIDVLRDRGLLENTIVIFTSDQGAAYHRAKASVYYAGLHVPLIWHGPGVPVPGMRSEALISLTDLMPTILDVLRLPIPKTVQGHSFMGIMSHGGSARYQGYVFGEHNSHGPARAEHYPSRMVFDGRYYYIRNLLPDKTYELPADLKMAEVWGNHAYDATVAAENSHPLPYALLRQLENGRPAEELYDIKEDPNQVNNLAGQAAYTSQKSNLSTALTNWRKRTGDLVDDPLFIPTRQPLPPTYSEGVNPD
ncbi:sulfatase family protein [Neolewinella persica]|uniref:sulfatase family protein n=1 Tax=Neolewinella persica TaxID=70998 RepID=UPI00039B7DB5|nr:sulfatase [Neolewinella persica]